MVRLFASSLLAALAVVSFTLMLPMTVAHADMIPSAPASTPATSDTVAPEQVVAGQMAALGLTNEEIADRMAELTDSDVATIAANPEQVHVAGSAWALIAFGIAAFALIAILVLDSLNAKEAEQYRTY